MYDLYKSYRVANKRRLLLPSLFGKGRGRYLLHAHPLNKAILRQAAKIRDDTKTVPGIAELLRRILETEMGVKQEVVEY